MSHSSGDKVSQDSMTSFNWNIYQPQIKSSCHFQHDVNQMLQHTRILTLFCLQFKDHSSDGFASCSVVKGYPFFDINNVAE